MKNLVHIWIILLGFCLVISCKDSEFVSSTGALKSDKIQAIKRGEPVLFTFKADTLGRKIEWQVSPAEKVTIRSTGRSAKITFENAGNYSVIASNDLTTERVNVVVDTSTYVPSDTVVADTVTHVHPPVDTVGTDTTTWIPEPQPPVNPDSISTTTLFTGSDELIITPAILDSIPYPSISFSAITASTYKCSSASIQFNVYESSGLIRIEYSGVREEFSCTGGNYQAKSFYTYHKRITDRVTKLEISIKDVTYAGTITSDGTSFTIDWPDNPNIKFSKNIYQELKLCTQDPVLR